MKKLLVAALAVGTMSAFAPVAHAAPSPSGFTCAFASTDDPQVEDDTQVGEIDGGPLVFTDDTDPTVTYTGRIVCTIQTGTNDTHDEHNSATCEGNTGLVSVALCTLTYEVGADEDVYLCTSAVIDGGGTLYWDSTLAGGDGDWSSSVTAPCDLAISADTP